MRSALPQALLLVLVASATAPTQAQQPAQQEQQQVEGVYSFVGAIDGDATLFAARSGAQSELEVHLPILRGDRIWTRPYGRLAVLMSDRSILALDHDSEVTFAQIAGSPDADDADSLFVLHRGRLSLDVAEHLLDSELPAIDTTNARVYAKQEGRYQVESDGDAWTEVAVLEGFAEIVTQRGSVIVRGGEALLINGLDDPWIELQSGTGTAAAALELWADGHRARLAAYAAVDSGGYGSALTGHGQWVEIEDRRAWRPDVKDDWQPYTRGRWTHTPAGLYWVARDPWGPLTYHYGSWNLYPDYGWLWFPSAIYSPSHVYWYWGPSYVGWIPRGYYQRYYGGLGFGLRYGLYGWAGGFWDPFNSWIFCPTGYLGYGRGYTYGRSLRRRHPKLSRGIITTDTNGIDYRNWRNPNAVQQVLLSKHPRFSENELPDVTDFIARRADLNESLRTRLTRDDADPGIVTVTGGPSRSGLVGVTAGGVKTGPGARVSGAGGSTASGVTVRRTAPGQLQRADGGAAGTTRTRGAGTVPSDPRAPSDAETRIRPAETPQPARVSSGGVKASPAPTAAAEADEPGNAGATAPSRIAAPRSTGGTIDRSRRPTPGRRVLDAIRGREATPGQPRTATPSPKRPDRVSTPRTATPTRTRSAPPRASRPSSPPTRTRSTPPRASSPRSSPPTRTRSTPPRASSPRSSPPTRTRSTPPRASSPRSSPPTRTRSTPPRASSPRSSPPTRTRSTPPRASSPRSTPPRTRSTPRTSSPRSSSPPSRSYSPPSSSYSPPTASSPPPAASPSSPPSGGGRTPPRLS